MSKKQADLIRKNHSKLIKYCKSQVKVLCNLLYEQEVLTEYLKDNILELTSSYELVINLFLNNIHQSLSRLDTVWQYDRYN